MRQLIDDYMYGFLSISPNLRQGSPIYRRVGFFDEIGCLEETYRVLLGQPVLLKLLDGYGGRLRNMVNEESVIIFDRNCLSKETLTILWKIQTSTYSRRSNGILLYLSELVRFQPIACVLI